MRPSSVAAFYVAAAVLGGAGVLAVGRGGQPVRFTTARGRHRLVVPVKLTRRPSAG